MSEDEKNHKNKQRLEEIMQKIYKKEILSRYNIKDEQVSFW